MGKKSGPAQPAAPDPVATAAAQSTLNKETAIAQANLNRINQYTPQGNITYQTDGQNSDGTPRWKQFVTLSPDEQKKYDQQNQIALSLNKLAGDNVSRVQNVQAQPFSFDGAQPTRTSIGAGLPFGLKAGPGQAYGTQKTIGPQGQVQGSVGPANVAADARRVADAVYGQATSRLNPQWQQREADTRARLAAQGISENSDAYRREMDNMGRDRNDAYNAATFAAQQAGSTEQSRLFDISLNQGQFANQAQDQRFTQALGTADLFNQAEGQRFTQDSAAAGFNNQARAQAFNEDSAAATFNNQTRDRQIEEMSYLRNLPLNEIAALMGTGGSVNNPEFQPTSQVGVAAPDYMGAVYNTYNAQMNAYNQKQANRSSGLGSIFGALGSVGAAAISDIRFKENIKRVGTLANGIKTYLFSYIGDSALQFGVMAHEVFRVKPEAVGIVNDVMYVDYGKVYE